VAMRFELRLHKHQHKHTNWPRPRRRAPHHARGIARLPCDECLGPRDRRFSHTDRAARGCEAAVGTQPVPACSRIATSGRRSTAVERRVEEEGHVSAVGCISLPSRTAGPPDLRTLRRRRTARHRGPRPPGARVTNARARAAVTYIDPPRTAQPAGPRGGRLPGRRAAEGGPPRSGDQNLCIDDEKSYEVILALLQTVLRKRGSARLARRP